MKLWVLTLMLFSCFCSTVLADDFWEQHAVGWHWYQDPRANQTPSAPMDPVQIMETWQRQVKYSLDQAILDPTPDNVRNYITLQNQISSQASQFAQTWQAVLLSYPQLDYSLKHPTNNVAKQIYLDQQQQDETTAIQQLAQHSGLFFFYRSTCPYCQRFAPIVKDFSQRYSITVVPITTDGIALPSFPASRIDQGQAAHFNVTEEPALFTVDPYTHQAVPVGYGLMTEDELRQRILHIAQNWQKSGVSP
ncbi:MAG TPA: type-F conjugative transfer system pilin assembly protein TraF [Gammaproteobacteria bacterium]|nr:type-F conjugative transfer system pilin assembly protein TraF [Gammaproteobacteria bacterium]